jgi:hypothetical protein
MGVNRVSKGEGEEKGRSKKGREIKVNIQYKYPKGGCTDIVYKGTVHYTNTSANSYLYQISIPLLLLIPCTGTLAFLILGLDNHSFKACLSISFEVDGEVGKLS